MIWDNLFNYLMVFAAGTFAGSFFYTLSLKYINGEMKENPFKALMGRSSCPCCGGHIGFLYLVPVLGYFFSAGKCRECSEAISPLYPVWEFIYGILASAVYYFYGYSLYSLFIFLIFSISTCIALIDYYTYIIPDSLIIAFFVMSVYPVLTQGKLLNNAAGFGFLAIFFLVVMLVFPGAFGGGDLKLFSAAGFFFGLEEAVVFLEVTLISGAAAGTLWALMKKKGLRVRIPFAPFIAFGIIVTVFFSRHILLWYYSLLY